MARFDVYANAGSHAATTPYLLDVQSDLLDGLATRLTIPLATLSYSGKVPSALCPLVTVKGQRLHALAHFAAPVPAKLLRKPVASVVTQASALVAAMDAVLSGD